MSKKSNQTNKRATKTARRAGSELAPAGGWAVDVMVDVRDALKLLDDQHIRANQHRLGVLGSQDVEMAKIYLSSALKKLPIG